jgi:GMP synthase-like glutamine amidotransferase
MNIHYLKHVPFEGLGFIDNWVRNPEHKVTATKFYEDHKLPFVDICDMLIVMGGPMSVGDDHIYPWLKEEKKFIEKAIAKGKKVLGMERN